MDETIFALATAKGRAGVAVVRVSGSRAFSAAESLIGARPKDRVASLRSVKTLEGELIDQALVIFFPGPGSFTGEDTVEFQMHGSLAVCDALLVNLARIKGLRQALPGEFTRRALLNGRLDLAQVEGLGDLIQAETAAQRRLALRMMDGVLSRKAQAWRAELVNALAFVEASIDFSDEDLPEDLLGQIEPGLRAVRRELEGEVTAGRISERIREGFQVALVGAPNVGKSTLLNAIAGRDAAIVSSVAGTTRDVIEVRMDLDGLPVTFLDTAGVRVTEDEVERIGVARTIDRARTADVRVFLVSDRREVAGSGIDVEEGDLVVFAKSDLGQAPEGLSVSGVTGAGIAELLERISQELGGRASGAGTASHARQVNAIRKAVGHVTASIAEAAAPSPRPEIVSAELRGALAALDFLVGKVDVDAVLDVIFSSFCLGK